MVYKRPVDEDEDTPEQSSNDFARMLDQSLSQGAGKRKLRPGDKVHAEVLSVGKDQTIVSTGTLNDGFVLTSELLDEEGKSQVKVGDFVNLFVTQIRGSEIYLSTSPTAKNLADDLEDAFQRNLVIEGRVESTTNGGFRVLVMGKSAFCPISQIDIKRVDVPEEYVGKKFDFKITQYSGRNIVVSRRRLLEAQKSQALSSFADERKPGDTVTGVVTRLEKFGAFVEIAPGIEGLAHISELSWSRVNDPKDVLEPGQQVSAKILKIEPDGDRLKISLSLKQVQLQPWLNLPPDLQEGRVLEGKVTRCVKFGCFVELFPGIEGLVPLSEMSYTKRVARSDEIVKEGEKTLVMVKEIDATNHRLTLSLRDAGADPWALVPEKFPAGKIVKGRVERREAYGLFIQLEEGVTGLLPKSRALESADFGYDRLKPGDMVSVRVAELKPDERRISLDVPNEQGGEDWKEYVAANPKVAPTNMGAMGLLGAQLKAAMEKKPKK